MTLNDDGDFDSDNYDLMMMTKYDNDDIDEYDVHDDSVRYGNDHYCHL